MFKSHLSQHGEGGGSLQQVCEGGKIMPLPTSSMGTCIRYVRRKHPDWPHDQRVAACLTALRKAGKDVAPKKK